MIQFNRVHHFLFLMVLVSLIANGCKSKPTISPIFELKNAQSTGLDFNNKLTPTQQFNVLTYLYFYNGSGIGAGDFNNDGKIDLFFAANQVNNKLYLNQGNLHFKDVTKESMIPNDGGWSTGVSVVDINNDGLLDIYVCKVGNYETLHSKNQLLICQGIKNGIPFYKDEAHEYGLDFSGFSTQAVFFDYDGDGDLDMYLLNHSTHENGTFGARDVLINRQTPTSGDRIFRNEGNGHFTDVTKSTGINSSVLGYGLGINVSDINLDGYPDVYIGNDFHENDYLYINQHDGTFKDELSDHVMHTSKYTMGVDIGDANNDGYSDIISMDMLAADPYILKRSLADDEPDIFNLKIGLGYNYQYSRNNLQLNRRNGMFSEIGLYSDVAATDWSWSPLWMDFDNDGLKDLFVSNGIPKRLNDIDYLNFMSNQEIQEKLSTHNFNINDIRDLDKFPEIKIPNKFFKNDGKMQFTDEKAAIDNDKNSFSNGAVYADFDNDGDLDIAVNNIDQTVFLYRNTSNDKKNSPFISIKLKGPAKNINALGSKVIVYANEEIRTYENYPVHGFMSSMQIPIHIGLKKTKVDSILVVWPDNTYQQIHYSKPDTFITATIVIASCQKTNDNPTSSQIDSIASALPKQIIDAYTFDSLNLGTSTVTHTYVVSIKYDTINHRIDLYEDDTTNSNPYDALLATYKYNNDGFLTSFTQSSIDYSRFGTTFTATINRNADNTISSIVDVPISGGWVDSTIYTYQALNGDKSISTVLRSYENQLLDYTYKVTYNYNADNSLTKVSNEDQGTYTYSYNPNNSLQSFSLQGTDITANANYSYSSGLPDQKADVFLRTLLGHLIHIFFLSMQISNILAIPSPILFM
jgi:hypothetical protein